MREYFIPVASRAADTISPDLVVKSVDRRAATLPREYSNHARDVDREYGGVEAGVVGPVQAKLLSFPPLRRWVFGGMG